MEPVRVDLERRLQQFSPRPLSLPVFSPIVGRYYRPADRLTRHLADHLVQPVRFARAIELLHAEGVRVFVECGALNALSRLAAKAAPAPDVTTVACLARPREEVASLRRATATLGELGLLRRCGSVGVTSGESHAPLSTLR
jgi:acyl transferase domain-containing protein